MPCHARLVLSFTDSALPSFAPNEMGKDCWRAGALREARKAGAVRLLWFLLRKSELSLWAFGNASSI